MNISVFGGSGFVGSSILTSLRGRNNKVSAPKHIDLDILDNLTLEKYIEKESPKVVINLTAYANQIEAQKEKGNKSGLVWKLNVDALQNLAKICKKKDIFLLHFSTDAIFSGLKDFPGPYTEDDVPSDNPELLSWYAYTKLKGEEVLRKTGGKFAIIRISYPFGNSNSDRDLVKKKLQHIETGISLFYDQKFTPTYLPDLVIALKRIIETRKSGIYHVVCNPVTTEFEFGKYLASKLKLKNKVTEKSLKTFKLFPKSMFGGLDNTRTQKILDIKLHTWRKAISEFAPLLLK